MSHGPNKTLPREVWVAFGAICLVGIFGGLAGGADELSEVLYGVIQLAVPVVFTIWAVAKLEPGNLGKITGHDRWREEQERRDNMSSGDQLDQKPKRAEPR